MKGMEQMERNFSSPHGTGTQSSAKVDWQLEQLKGSIFYKLMHN